MRSAIRLLTLACLLALGLVGLAVPAGAVPTCAYDAATFTAAITVGDAETATIARSGDAITLDGVACGAATVTTTDTITVTATGTPAAVVLNLSGGPFAPGQAAEPEGEPEIEFTIALPTGSPALRVVGSAMSDNVVVGDAGINLNAAEAAPDADVTVTGTPAITLEGGDGDDVLSLGGGAGAGAAVPGGALLGQGGDDRLLGGLGGSAIDGGDGTDEADYTGATQLVLADLGAGTVEHEGEATDTLLGIENLTGSPGDDVIVGDAAANVLRGGEGADTLTGGDGDDTLDGEGGSDTLDLSTATNRVTVDLRAGTASGQGEDDLASIENVLGSPHNDVLLGGAGPNTIDGGAGNDTIEGGPGNDALDGGAGIDTVSFASSNKGVTADLKEGAATGPGNDTLVGFENLTGSDRADVLTGTGKANRLDGLGGPDELHGGNGADIILGGNGNDLLFGEGGADVLRGEADKDQLNGGPGRDRCKGGEDPDSFVFCENFPT